MANAMNLSFNNVEVTPNLNKLAKEGMFFSNFYSQVSVGTSSDSELTYNTSLMPTKSGTAFVSYADRTLITTPKMLKEQGYYVYVMHANNADFWNRRVPDSFPHLGSRRSMNRGRRAVGSCASSGVAVRPAAHPRLAGCLCR